MCFNSVGNDIFWNNEELPLRYVNKPSDTFTCDGGPCTDHTRYYQKLPDNIGSRFPMRGTKDLISSMRPNMLYLPQNTIAYYFLETSSNATHSPVDWIDTGYYDEFLGKGVNAKIFKRIMSAGIHIIDHKNAALLFTTSGKLLFKTTHIYNV